MDFYCKEQPVLRNMRITYLSVCVLVFICFWINQFQETSNTRPEEDHLFSYHENFRYGYIDKTGKVILEPVYNFTSEFSEGLGAVRVNSYWGYVNRKGKFVIHPKYKSAQSFKEGLALVSDEHHTYYIDKTGKEILRVVGKTYLRKIESRFREGRIKNYGKLTSSAR